MAAETVFENRFMHVAEFRMNANINVEGAKIEGKSQLQGAQVNYGFKSSRSSYFGWFSGRRYNSSNRT